MPELPEVEQIRRTLEPAIVGGIVAAARVFRRDVIVDHRGTDAGRIRPSELLVGSRIERLHRHGKNLTIISDAGNVICIHLGMSGQLLWRQADSTTPSPQPSPPKRGRGSTTLDHIHVQWSIHRKGTEHADKRPASKTQNLSPRLRVSAFDSPTSTGTLLFRDPRRFGGIWLFGSLAQLQATRFATLGPDALTIDGAILSTQLRGSARSIKAALLDQSVIAGVGNIYADEALFRAGIHPTKSARTLKAAQLDALAVAVVEILNAAIDSGGSTIRSYVDSTGQGGSFAQRHMVYGRAGQPCRVCEATLRHTTVCQRTTTFCPTCQSRSGPHDGSTTKTRAKSTKAESYPQSNNTLGGAGLGRAVVRLNRGVNGSGQAQRRRRVLVTSSSP